MEERLESMSIEITKNCNFKCKFCFASSNKCSLSEDTIPQEHYDRIIEQIKLNNLKKVTITGGEPLCCGTHFLSFVQLLSENGITINLNTNLSLMNDDFADAYTRYIGNEFYVFTSLLSADEDNCDKMTGVKGSYQSIIRGIRCCKKHGIKISMNFTISKDNANDIELIPQFVEKYGIDRVCISRVIPPIYDRYSESNSLSNSDIIKIADTLVQINESLGIPVTSSHPLPLCIIGDNPRYSVIEAQRCRTGTKYCAVNLHTGDVIACSQENHVYGNVYSETLFEIWDKMRIDHGILNLKEKCIDCSLLSKCGGECRWSGCSTC